MRDWKQINGRRYERNAWALIRSGVWSALGPAEHRSGVAYLRNSSLSIRQFRTARSAARAVDIELARRAKRVAAR